ncbi:MAG: hypothetical protein IJK01_10595 [Clostridia bacterium]|jgi:hypothetical protein|nr:hypothetical protein [Clostridia bacterium]
MNSILNMKRRIGLGLLWLPGPGLALSALELFTNKSISDEDRALCWTILLTHLAESILMCFFFLGAVLSIVCLVYAILTFCGKTTPDLPGLTQLGKILAKATKPQEPQAPVEE